MGLLAMNGTRDQSIDHALQFQDPIIVVNNKLPMVAEE
jgi:hypothetical protein